LGLLNLAGKGLLCDQLHQEELEICIGSRSRTQGCDVYFDQVFFFPTVFLPFTTMFSLFVVSGVIV